MYMYKFEVGDLVRGISDNRYRVTNKDMTKGKVVGVDDDGEGIKVEILEHKDSDCIGLTFDVLAKYFELIESVKVDPIVIYQDKADRAKVIAVNKNTGEKAEAKCSPEDTFDFNYGAELAFSRLTSAEKEKRRAETEIKVGDKVKVINSGECYSSYHSWSGLRKDEAFLLGFHYDRSLYEYKDFDTKDFVVRYIGKHDDYKDKTLAIIQPIEYKSYLPVPDTFIINVEGLKKE